MTELTQTPVPFEGAVHLPTRGSDVELYIKQYRDAFPQDHARWLSLDIMLEDYRLRADTGTSLFGALHMPGDEDYPSSR